MYVLYTYSAYIYPTFNLSCQSWSIYGVLIVSQAQKTQKPPQKASPTVTTVAPVVKDPLVKKAEIKPKPDTTGSFQAFKRTEVKVRSLCLSFFLSL